MMDDLSHFSSRDSDKMAIAVGNIREINEYGYGIKPKIEIFEDILLDNKRLDSKKLLKGTYEKHYLKIRQNIPIYKYSSNVEQALINQSSLVKAYLEEKQTLNSYLNKSLLKDIKNVPFGNTYEEIPSSFKTTRRRKYLWLFKNIRSINLSEIKDFLLEELPKYDSFGGNEKGYFNRLISMYDLLMYKK